MVDGGLVLLLFSAAFLLGCWQLFDADVWWHLAGGRWILQHGHFPGKDPFTFGSADQVWIDLNWLFQVPAVWLFDRGGVPALVLLAAAVGTATLVCAASAHQRSWSVALGMLGWMPALILMSNRFRPRPEVFTLLYLAAFLAVLWQSRRRPAWIWLLPLIQVLWVNTHGVFVLGPVVLAFFALDKAVDWTLRRRRGGAAAARWSEWKHFAPATAAVLLACLVNPYFIDGALFPLILLPKVTGAGNIYKQYIYELHGPRDCALRGPNGVGAGDIYIRTFFFVALVLPATYILPAVWYTLRRGGAPGGSTATAPADATGVTGRWLSVLAIVFVVAALATASLPGWAGYQWLAGAETAVPLSFICLGAVSAWSFRQRSPSAAMIALCGGLFLAAWSSYLRAHLVDPRPPSWFEGGTGVSASQVLALLSGLVLASWLVARPTGLFRLLLGVAFIYLSLQAVKNFSVLGVVAGTLIAWNLGEWSAELRKSAAAGGRPEEVSWWVLRVGILVLLAVWVGALATDHFHPLAGEHLGLSEKPFVFAHDAARFAGAEGMPQRALVYDMTLAALYTYHNAPRCKAFMDARLELPSFKTFEQYATLEDWLQRKDPRWIEVVHQMGDPLILISHTIPRNAGAEAALLQEPSWRCIYYDAMASVFVRRADDGPALNYSDVDFAARLLRPDRCPPIPAQAGAALREAQALFGLALSLQLEGHGLALRQSLLLGALGRAEQALKENPSSGTAWAVLGDCQRQLSAAQPTPQLTDAWDATRVIPWAQSTYCYLEAHKRAPAQPDYLNLLYYTFRARKMADAQMAMGEQLRELGVATPEQDSEIDQLHRAFNAVDWRVSLRGLTLADRMMALLQRGQPEAAIQWAAEAAPQQALPWSVADRLAAACLHLGRPDDARRIWKQAKPPAAADRLCRLAAASWVEHNLPAAVELYREALQQDSRCAEAGWALAMLYTQAGQAPEALAACRSARDLKLTAAMRTEVNDREELLRRFAAQVSR